MTDVVVKRPESSRPGATTEISLVQQRAASFCLGFGLVLLASTVARALIAWAWRDGPLRVPIEAVALPGLAGLVLLVAYGLLRRQRRSRRFVRVTEAIALMASAALFQSLAFAMTFDVLDVIEARRLAASHDTVLIAWMSASMPLVVVSFMLTYALVLRAAFVPTPARYTGLLTLVLGAPLAAVAYVAGTGMDALGSELVSAPVLAAGGIAQWAFTAGVCMTVSRVIYGLRAEVRTARRLGQYTLEELIGEGGMGMVYRASHLLLRRPTAIKLLPPDRAGAEAVTRFEREVQLTAQLTHPNTVTIYDYGRTGDGIFYYAMELLDGATLEEVVTIDGPQPAARVVQVLDQVAGALAEAHAIGLIHRDVKPANIVLCRRGGELDVAKIVDFGLVKEIDDRGAIGVSRDGAISGTPLYMAPEILRESNAASARSDLYALGAVGYYLLTGEHVFDGQSVIEILGHHLYTAPESPSSRLGDPVPPALEALILECLAKDPAARPHDMEALRQRLEACALVPWTQRQARVWWDAHGPEVVAMRARRRRKVARTHATIAVDVARRKSGTSAPAAGDGASAGD